MAERTITARRLLTDIGTVEFPVVEVAADGTIAGISSDPGVRDESTLTATFVDIHTHGGAGVDVMHADAAGFVRLGEFFARHGVGHYLPTTATASVDDTLRALERIATAIEAAAARDPHGNTAAQPAGIHLEGPFLAHAKRGVHAAELLQPPSVELFARFQDAARGHIQLLTLAPELPGALALIRYAADHGVHVSLGHTNATAAEALAAIEAGATAATHTFNAMRALDHREPGVLGTVLDPAGTLASELICDGVHVAAPLVRLWWHAMRASTLPRAMLVTDSIEAAGRPDGQYTLAGQPVTVQDGRALLTRELADGRQTLAGSVLTMGRAVGNLRAMTGTTLADAVAAASHTPAARLGHPEWTRLAPGSPASFNRYSDAGERTATYIHGNPVELG